MSSGPSPGEFEGAAPDPESDPDLNIDVLRRRREKTLTIFALVLIVAASVLVALRVGTLPPPDRTELIAGAQDYVRQTFGVHLAFHFGGRPEFRIEMLDQNRYSVKGEVLVLSRAADSAHYWFECTMSRGTAGKWEPSEMKLTTY